MNVEIKLCDLCRAALKGPGVARKFNGVHLTFGFSLGGWGYRQNDVDWVGEVCEKCYEEYKTIAIGVGIWLSKRSGVRAPDIIIREHHVSVVQTDEPSSNGRERALLR